MYLIHLTTATWWTAPSKVEATTPAGCISIASITLIENGASAGTISSTTVTICTNTTGPQALLPMPLEQLPINGNLLQIISITNITGALSANYTQLLHLRLQHTIVEWLIVLSTVLFVKLPHH